MLTVNTTFRSKSTNPVLNWCLCTCTYIDEDKVIEPHKLAQRE